MRTFAVQCLGMFGESLKDIGRFLEADPRAELDAAQDLNDFRSEFCKYLQGNMTQVVIV